MHRRLLLLQRLVALAALVLIAVTWKLWTPQTVYPQVPLVAGAGAAPVYLEWAAAAVMLAALVVALIVPAANRVRRNALLLYAAAAVGLVIIDQHRLQPWAYQFVLMALVLGSAAVDTKLRTPLALTLIRLLVISIYFHSALSKLDFSFLDSYGQDLLLGTLERFGVHSEFWSPPPVVSRRRRCRSANCSLSSACASVARAGWLSAAASRCTSACWLFSVRGGSIISPAFSSGTDSLSCKT